MKAVAKGIGIAAVVVVAVAGVLSGLRADIATPRPRWTKVQMAGEQVNITLAEKRVDVEAVFHMYNEGKAGPVRMGYPVGVFEDELHDFKVFADDKPIRDVRSEANPARPTRGPRLGGMRAPGGTPGRPGRNTERYRFEGPYRKWMVFDVPMGENEPKTVKVRYWVKPAAITDAQKRKLLHYTYTLRTGATWKGRINEAVIRVALKDVEPDRILRKAPVGCKASKDGKTLTWTMRDFKPVDNIELTFLPAQTVRTAMATQQ
jgi:hypothetical protein